MNAKKYLKDFLPTIKNIIQDNAFYELNRGIMLKEYIKPAVYKGKDIHRIFNSFDISLTDFSLYICDKVYAITMSYNLNNVLISQTFSLKRLKPSIWAWLRYLLNKLY